ncbi:nickel transport system (permease) [Roseibium aggregatum IAM 12614]|uniref:Nickel transport system (Permease) n=1 Tax=Roseibium aggregatum (strain ATCC 25650 / DSM 13394 / JCM 20685 / NBRC 16684 / NCIMB 2208 / IAM 12614 / B1) TaxID=384765 RepID=A0NPC3_ROSAI|nr:ABC transporter permease [Roseibium aggregatum]EAV45286.1 nickel transport system (permease) [Roseibium aggregatum IAM 12614]
MARAHSLFRPKPDAQRRQTRAGLLACLILMIVLAPLAAPYPPDQIDILNRLVPPGWPHLLGTDQMGRDVFSRLLYAGRLTTGAALLVVLASALTGTLLGCVCGYLGGWPDQLLMRFCEGLSVLPALAIAMIIAGVMGLGLAVVLLALTAVHWTEYARLVRNMILVERAKLYVQAAEALGSSRRRIVHRHLLPNIAAPLLTMAAYSLSWVILAFAGLSFLGLGVEPGTAEWGRMIADARNHMRSHPHLVLAPGLTITAFVMLVNLLGDGIGDRMRSRHTNLLTLRKTIFKPRS